MKIISFVILKIFFVLAFTFMPILMELMFTFVGSRHQVTFLQYELPRIIFEKDYSHFCSVIHVIIMYASMSGSFLDSTLFHSFICLFLCQHLIYMFSDICPSTYFLLQPEPGSPWPFAFPYKYC